MIKENTPNNYNLEVLPDYTLDYIAPIRDIDATIDQQYQIQQLENQYYK